MPCTKFEERIYLYAELSPEERKVLDEHVHQCASCQMLMSEVQSMMKSIKTFSALHPVPRNNARLTHKIMAGIEQSKSKNSSVLLSLNRVLGFSALRYALAVVSIIMVISFIAEHNITQKRTYAESEKQVSEMSSVLNTNHFLKTIEITRLGNTREKRFSISSCLSTNTCDQLSYFKTKKNHEQSH